MYVAKCKQCSLEFKRILSPDHIKKGKGKYCSKLCSNIGAIGRSPWNKGKTMSQKYRDTMSRIQKGKKRKPLSEETKKKISLANTKLSPKFCPDCSKSLPRKAKNTYCVKCSGSRRRKPRKKCLDCKRELSTQKPIRCFKCSLKDPERFIKLSSTLKKLHLRPTNAFKTGNLHPNWSGGTNSLFLSYRRSPRYKKLRRECFLRDNYTCVLCGNKNSKNNKVTIECDHIISVYSIFKKYNIISKNTFGACPILWDITNLRTLCKECHKKTDTYGIKALSQKTDLEIKKLKELNYL